MNKDRTFIDSHIHTVYSGHGEGSVAQVAAAAHNLGLSSIAFTEHLIMPEGIDPMNTFSLSEATQRSYIAEVREQQALYDDMDIVLGAEVDWLGDPVFITEHADPYDYLIGSVHFIDGWAFDDPAEVSTWADHDVDEAWHRYVEIWCEAVTSTVRFDCMSHPDLPKKFGNRPDRDLMPLYQRMAEAAASVGCAIEVNTSGFFHPAGEQYPALPLLEMFHDAGVACTVGSDCHRPQDLFRRIPEALDLMRSAGYRELMVPSGHHERRFVMLEG